MGIAILHRVVVCNVWAARQAFLALFASCRELRRCDRAAAVIHLSFVEAHGDRSWWYLFRTLRKVGQGNLTRFSVGTIWSDRRKLSSSLQIGADTGI